MKNSKTLERKSSADRITCFLPLYYNPLIIYDIFVKCGLRKPIHSKILYSMEEPIVSCLSNCIVGSISVKFTLRTVVSGKISFVDIWLPNLFSSQESEILSIWWEIRHMGIGTCGQDPMSPPFFPLKKKKIHLFSYKQHFATLYVSLYDI